MRFRAISGCLFITFNHKDRTVLLRPDTHMTRIESYTPGDDLHRTLAAMIRIHGLRRVLMAALRSRTHPPPHRRSFDARRLNNHIRRDIGLTPVSISPPDWTRHL